MDAVDTEHSRVFIQLKKWGGLIPFFLLVGCAQIPVEDDSPTINYLDSLNLRQALENIPSHFGGISGIDYDPVSEIYFLISDDRSKIDAARFYLAKIDIERDRFQQVKLLESVQIKQANGLNYPSTGGEVPDPESIRFHPIEKKLYWTSEGSASLNLNPFLRCNTIEGAYCGEITLPPMFNFYQNKLFGARDNLSIEGLTFSGEPPTTWLAMEAPLYQDGQLPSYETGAFIRISKLKKSGELIKQFAYPVDRIPKAATGGKKRSDNGVSEILALDDNHILVLERAGYEVADSVFRFATRLYLVSVDGATDVKDFISLRENRFNSLTKRLLADLSTAVPTGVDNLEGMTWGPRLSNGSRSLIFVSDDNFAKHQITQLILFEFREGRH